ncbi:interferon gamma related [Pangasianodon hypophthalmus]|uniref:interferon gamma related n=1 Tax=Pangasianodon hypophthalmus TaxID=310915 RepID=UPI000F00B309|nr:interferon gamma related [Pangasianodon hypophthalmus]
MDSWSNLVLICGLVMMPLLNGTAGHGIHNLTKAVRVLQIHHGLKDPEWVGKAVFTPYLGKVEDTCTCEKLMLLRMLNGYMDIFSDMLKKAKTVETENSLKELQESVKELKDKYKKEQEVWTQLHKINTIQKDDSTIQGGAVNDFINVYDKALEAGQHSKKTHSPLKRFLQR